MKLEECVKYDIVKLRRFREDGKPVFGRIEGQTGQGIIHVTFGYMSEHSDWCDPESLTAVPSPPNLATTPLPEGATPMYAAVTPEGVIISVDREENWAYSAAIERYCDDFSVPRDVTYGCAHVDREAAVWLGYRVYPVLIIPSFKDENGHTDDYILTLYARKR